MCGSCGETRVRRTTVISSLLYGNILSHRAGIGTVRKDRTLTYVSEKLSPGPAARMMAQKSEAILLYHMMQVWPLHKTVASGVSGGALWWRRCDTQ